MARGLGQSRVTKLVAQVGKVNLALKAKERSRRAKRAVAQLADRVRHLGVNESEAEFLHSLSVRRPRASVARSGWPDFLVVEGNKIYGVEVKRGEDTVRANQRKMFSLLNLSGIPVFVWHAANPTVLVPWRKFSRSKRELLASQVPEGLGT